MKVYHITNIFIISLTCTCIIVLEFVLVLLLVFSAKFTGNLYTIFEGYTCRKCDHPNHRCSFILSLVSCSRPVTCNRTHTASKRSTKVATKISARIHYHLSVRTFVLIATDEQFCHTYMQNRMYNLCYTRPGFHFTFNSFLGLRNLMITS